MKTLHACIIFFFIFFLSNVVQSQVIRGSGIKYSIGAETGLAVNYLAKKYQMLSGISFQADFPIVDKELFASINSGFNNAFVKSAYRHLVDDMHIIPVKAGLKYFFKKEVYAQSEIGVSFLLNKTNCVEGKNKAFVFSPQIGAVFNIMDNNYVDIGLRFESTGKFYECDNQNSFVGMRVAWAFTM